MDCLPIAPSVASARALEIVDNARTRENDSAMIGLTDAIDLNVRGAHYYSVCRALNAAEYAYGVFSTQVKQINDVLTHMELPQPRKSHPRRIKR